MTQEQQLLEAVKLQKETIGHLISAVQILHDRIVVLERKARHNGGPRRKWLRRDHSDG